jgi:holo-[acyl-carrier protein] synthase
VILGLGVDLVEVARMEHAIGRGERLVQRLFTPEEIAYCRRHKEPARHFAARFAAKEAGMKAIGTGWSNGVSWRDFEVRLDPRGRPHLFVTGRAAEFAHAMGATHSVISLAHDGGLATAVVALEGPAAEAGAAAAASGRTEIGAAPPPASPPPTPPAPPPGPGA